MKWAPFLIPVLLAIAFLWGWSFPGRPQDPPGVVRGAGGGPDSGLVLRPGESTAAAVRFLSTLQSDPPPPAPPPVVLPPPPPPPPPPPDVAVTFRAALSGITRDPASGRYGALVRDPAAPGPQITSMRVGDRFGDGWRISQISADAVTLRKGRETRVVRLYG